MSQFGSAAAQGFKQALDFFSKLKDGNVVQDFANSAQGVLQSLSDLQKQKK